MTLDLAIRGGTVATAADSMRGLFAAPRETEQGFGDLPPQPCRGLAGGGVVRVSMVHDNTLDEHDRLVGARDEGLGKMGRRSWAGTADGPSIDWRWERRMPDSRVAQAVMSLADYEAFVATRPEDERWEMIGGVVEMMTNPTGNHGQIAMNIAMPLKAAMDAAGCRTYAGSMRVQRADRRDAGDAAIPDIVVHCGQDRNRTFITDPLVVVEVLSRSTMDHDRGPKLAFYKDLPSLRHIALIYQDQMRVEHYYRTGDGWFLEILTRADQSLGLDDLDFGIVLETIYFDVGVLRPVASSDAMQDEPAGPVR